MASTSLKRRSKNTRNDNKKLKNNTNELVKSDLNIEKFLTCNIPKEMLTKILMYALDGNITNIQHLNSVCKLWHEACYDPYLWKDVNLASSSKSINFEKFLNYSINSNKYIYTAKLNLSGINEIKSNDLEMILKNCRQLKQLNASDCKKLKNDCFKIIADNCHMLNELNISSFSVSFKQNESNT